MFHRFFAHTSSETARNVKASSLLTALVLTMAVLLGFTASTAYAKNAQHTPDTSKQAVHKQNAKSVFAPKSNSAAGGHSSYRQKFHPNFTGDSTSSFANFQQDLPFTLGGEADAAGVAIDQYGNIFVTDYNSGNVYEESPNGFGSYTETLLFTVDTEGPTGIAVDAYDDLYIANDYTGEIIFASPNGDGWTYSTIFSGAPLSDPYGIAVDGGYNIYIADFSGGIYEMQWTGSSTWAAPVLLFSSPYPLGVAVDYYGENLYIADALADYIYEASYDYGTSSWDIFNDLGTNANPAGGGWVGVALAPNGDVYASNYTYSSLVQIVPSQFGSNANLMSDQLPADTRHIAVDAYNNVYVGSTASLVESFVNNFGSQPVYFGGVGDIQVNFWLADGVKTGSNSVNIETNGSSNSGSFYYDGDNCSNLTSTGQYCTVAVYFEPYAVGKLVGGVTLTDTDGALIASSQSFYGTGTGSQSTILPGTYNFIGGPYAYAKNAPSPFQTRHHLHVKNPKEHTAVLKPNSINYNYPGIVPTGIVVDPAQDIFVADQGYAGLNVPCNIYATYDGTNWVTLPMFNDICPSGNLAIDGSGNLFYPVWFDNAGTSEASIAVSYLVTPAYYDSGLEAVVPAVYTYPYEVATDTINNYGYLLHADAVAVDSADNVYFTGSDYSNLDDHIFVVPADNYEWTFNYAISELPAPYNTSLGYDAFQGAYGIAVDNRSDVYVTDYYTGSVWVEYPTTAGYDWTWLAGDFDTPTAISLDNNGNLYVLDTGDDSGVSNLNLLFASGSCYGGPSSPAPCYQNVPLISSPYPSGYSYLWNAAVDAYNDFYFVDFGYWGGLITDVDTYDPMSITFNETKLGVISADSPEFVYLYSSGNLPLNFTIPDSGYNPSLPNNFTMNSSSFYYFPGTHIPIDDCQQLSSASTLGYSVTTDYACAIPITFDPLTAGESSGSVLLTDDSWESSNYAVPANKRHNLSSKKHPNNGRKPLDGTNYVQDVVDVYGYGDAVMAHVMILSNWNPSLVQNSVAFAINVTGPGVTPTGIVDLYDGATLVGTGNLFQGATTIDVTFATIGSHYITATYEGDSNYDGNSSSLYQNVVDFTSAFQAGSGGSPTFCQSTPIVGPGQSLTLGFTIAPVAPATSIPGPITFSADGAPVGTTYVFSPTSLATGAGSTPVTLTLTIPQQFVADLNKPQGNNSKLPIAPLALAVLLLPLAGRMRKTSKRLIRMLSVALFVIAGISATAALSGCGVNTTATYEVVITSQSGTLFHTMSCDIIVK